MNPSNDSAVQRSAQYPVLEDRHHPLARGVAAAHRLARGLWLVSLALYAWSWQWGDVGLLGLSVAHVILEYHDQEEPEAKLPSLSELERSRIIRSVRTDGRDA